MKLNLQPNEKKDVTTANRMYNVEYKPLERTESLNQLKTQ